MVKLVILDRDGVINEDSDAFVKSAQEWRPIPGSLEGMARLYHAGYRLAIVTNQSGLARDLLDFDALGAIHDKLQRLLGELGLCGCIVTVDAMHCQKKPSSLPRRPVAA